MPDIEKGPQKVVTEPKIELYSPQDFLEKLYERTFEWMTKDQEGVVVTKIDPQKVDRWDSHQANPGQITQLSNRILKGVLVKTPKHNFALVLSHRRRSKYDQEETLGLQFGVLPVSWSSNNFEKSPPINKLRQLTVTGPSSYGSGDFYMDSMTRGICTDSWADSSIHDGVETNRWSQNELLTEKGINAYLEIVQRTTRNAFLR